MDLKNRQRELERQIRSEIARVGEALNFPLRVDRIEFDGQACKVSFRTEGTLSRFAFPFFFAVPVEKSVAALFDMLRRSGANANTPPPVRSKRIAAKSMTAGATA
jgi:hypothetical protein